MLSRCNILERRHNEEKGANNENENPLRFQPKKWARLAKESGFKYLVFTTKHHDGFCLFDTKYTDFKVTNPECPFSKDSRADIVRNVFDAFRAEGLGIAAYFSKPDWHCEDFWENHGIGRTVSRMPTYDVKANGKGDYATRPAAPYAKGKWRFTGSKDGKTLYAFRLWDEGERDLLAQTIPIESPESVASVRHLATGAAVPFRATKDGLAIRLPETFRTNPCSDGFEIAPMR